jgi:hypothetical protein
MDKLMLGTWLPAFALRLYRVGCCDGTGCRAGLVPKAGMPTVLLVGHKSLLYSL